MLRQSAFACERLRCGYRLSGVAGIGVIHEVAAGGWDSRAAEDSLVMLLPWKFASGLPLAVSLVEALRRRDGIAASD